jgi:biopolymer transport protein ExbD
MPLTSPLGLTRHLRRPDLRLEAVPWLNVLLVAWLLSLLGSRFVYAPGLAVDLGHAYGSPPPQLNLPVVSGGPMPGLPANAVMTVVDAKGDNMFIFDKAIFDRDTLAAYLRQRPKPPAGAPAILLLKMDQNVSMQTFMEICALARAAGFSTIQVAAAQSSSSKPPVAP